MNTVRMFVNTCLCSLYTGPVQIRTQCERARVNSECEHAFMNMRTVFMANPDNGTAPPTYVLWGFH